MEEETEEEALADVFASMNSIHRQYERRKSRRAGLVIPDSTTAKEIPADAPVMKRNLNASVRKGQLSEKRALQAARWVDKEVCSCYKSR